MISLPSDNNCNIASTSPSPSSAVQSSPPSSSSSSSEEVTAIIAQIEKLPVKLLINFKHITI
jgi:hypothetical protein